MNIGKERKKERKKERWRKKEREILIIFISYLRNNELKVMKDSVILRALAMVLWAATPIFVALVSFTIYGLTEDALTPEIAFTALSKKHE